MSALAALMAGCSGGSGPGTGTVPGCEEGCDTVFRLALPGDGWFAGLQPSAAGGRPRQPLLAYWVAGDLVAVIEPKAHTGIPGQFDTPGQSDEIAVDGIDAASCAADGTLRRCAVRFVTGAHSSGALMVELTEDRGIEVTDSAVASAGGTALVDLDHDGRADVITRQSTYQPFFAVAPQYWETYLEHGGKLVRTGCTTPTDAADDPVPAGAVDQPCPDG